jgi:hydroxymethylpyrimidine/phosphomethylpyrimidine kinase
VTPPGPSIPRLLIIAGSDSSAGAGIQADLKTAFAFGVYAQTAITAVTVQNTLGVTGAHVVPPDVVRDQIIACLSDIGADAIKTGMLGSAAMVKMVADTLAEHAADIPLVVDPVMVAKGGAPLIGEDAIAALKERLLPLATLITPNLPEAEVLMGFVPDLPSDAARVVDWMKAENVSALLLKGGHAISGGAVFDTLFEPPMVTTRAMAAIETPHTHGTGCTLATAIACGLAGGLPLTQSVQEAQDYVQRAIAAAPGLGRGHGPLGHKV